MPPKKSDGGNGDTGVATIQSEEDLQQLLQSKPRAILGFYAGWSRGSEDVIKSVTSQLVQTNADDVVSSSLHNHEVALALVHQASSLIIHIPSSWSGYWYIGCRLV